VPSRDGFCVLATGLAQRLPKSKKCLIKRGRTVEKTYFASFQPTIRVKKGQPKKGSKVPIVWRMSARAALSSRSSPSLLVALLVPLLLSLPAFVSLSLSVPCPGLFVLWSHCPGKDAGTLGAFAMQRAPRVRPTRFAPSWPSHPRPELGTSPAVGASGEGLPKLPGPSKCAHPRRAQGSSETTMQALTSVLQGAKPSSCSISWTCPCRRHARRCARSWRRIPSPPRPQGLGQIEDGGRWCRDGNRSDAPHAHAR
jgi:hypothetical protein